MPGAGGRMRGSVRGRVPGVALAGWPGGRGVGRGQGTPSLAGGRAGGGASCVARQGRGSEAAARFGRGRRGRAAQRTTERNGERARGYSLGVSKIYTILFANFSLVTRNPLTVP
jgi:hypothetical protein